MRILHLFNVGGVATVLAKFMDYTCKTETTVLTRKASDPYGCGKTRQCKTVNDGPYLFTLRSLWTVRKADLIHVHDFDKVMSWLQHLTEKPRVLHYHGRRIKNRWAERRRYWKHAPTILYGTPDLNQNDTPASALYLPTPVDTHMFRPMPKVQKQEGVALTMNNNAASTVAVLADSYDLKLVEHKCNVSYSEMPLLLNSFKYYVDAKITGRTLSKTGLEALACGLTVINWKGETLKGLPRKHHPENVVKRLYGIYCDALNS